MSKKDAAVSLVCPEEKLRIPKDRLKEPDEVPVASALR
jgi:hypothetical protein